MENYKNIVEDVLNIAKKRGVEADCILDASSQLSLKAENQELSEHKVSSTLTLGVRIIKDNKVGTSYSESWDPKNLNQMVDEAISFSNYTKEEPLESITLERSKEVDGTIDKIYQEDKTSLDEKIKFCLSLESEVKNKNESVKSAPYNNLSENEYQRIYGNHLGTLCNQKSKIFSCYTSALIEKDGQQSMHHHHSVGRNFNELDITSVVDESYNHANQLLGAKPIATGNYNIIFTPDCLSDLIGCFSTLFSGKSAMLDVNPFKAKINQKVAVEEFNFSDNPTLEDAFSYHPFDDEGNTTKNLDLISGGILKSFYHNSVTSEFFKCKNTFNASRSPKSTLGVSGSNQVIKPGNQPETEIKKNEYIEIITMQGLHSGADAISGNFSFGASGYLKEGNQIKKSIAGITISGNYFDLLKKINHIGDKTHSSSDKTFFSPIISFGGLKIAGV